MRRLDRQILRHHRRRDSRHRRKRKQIRRLRQILVGLRFAQAVMHEPKITQNPDNARLFGKGLLHTISACYSIATITRRQCSRMSFLPNLPNSFRRCGNSALLWPTSPLREETKATSPRSSPAFCARLAGKKKKCRRKRSLTAVQSVVIRIGWIIRKGVSPLISNGTQKIRPSTGICLPFGISMNLAKYPLA